MKTIRSATQFTQPDAQKATVLCETAAPTEMPAPTKAIISPETLTLLKTIAPLEKILFFDIETTGFSPDVAQIYLIGCLYYEISSSSWQSLQWFCEAPEDEPGLLRSFFTFLKPYTALIHYNGDAFDLPFIRRRCQIHQQDCPLSEIQSIDLYRKLRPWKEALGLPSLKQKAVEKFLGICRKDPYTGRQLIAAYQDYLASRKNALFHMLLFHNLDDLRGLFQIFPLILYSRLPEITFSLTRQNIIKKQENLSLELVWQSPLAFPAPFHLEGSYFAIEGQKMQLSCVLPMYQGELKYFFPDVQNYYYLPCEDIAIHKSVANYVARQARKKATPKTCYTRKTGLFFPQPTPLWTPAFQQDFQSRPYYAEYQEELFSRPQDAGLFLRQLFLLLPVFP